jgi:PAS domain S-box-containing protein
LVAGYLLLRDLNGKPILTMRVSMPRTIYAQGRVTLKYLILAIVGAGLVFVAMTDLLLHRMVLSRLERLTRSVAAIGAGQHFSARVSLPGSDELSMLAGSINGTLSSLEQAEAALVRTNASLEERIRERTAENVDNILQSMDEALIVTDPELRIRRVNPRTLRMLDYREEDLIGQPAGKVMADLGGGPGQATGAERTFQTRTGQLIPVLFSSAELRDGLGLLEGYVWLGQDVTELKRIQEEVVRARDAAEQANRAKSTFLANMSHELRTPLNAIIGYSQMLQEDCGLEKSENFRPDLMRIEKSGHMLLAIINDILDLSKIEAGRMDLRMEVFSVPDVLRDVQITVQPLAIQRSIRLEVACGAEVMEGYGDVAKFRQSLLNLANNACKFTENGTVAITARRVFRSERARLEVQVADSGIGIKPEHLGQLFQPFSQVDASASRKYGGTGLGLAISRKFCQMMGGDIGVESEVGKGSRFSMWIPAAEESQYGVGSPCSAEAE